LNEREICNSQCREEIDEEIASNVTYLGYEEDDCNRESGGQQNNEDMFGWDDNDDDFFNNGELKNDFSFIDIPDKF
jgi:hypothetical protein